MMIDTSAENKTGRRLCTGR